MSSVVVPTGRTVDDKVESHEDVKSGCVVQEDSQEPLSFLLPLPPVLPSVTSPASPVSDRAYLQASAIFQQLREEKPVTHELLHYGKKTDTPPHQSGDKLTQRQAYQLAFNTLKYQDLLEEIISDSCFHTSQRISADLLPLAMVMLYDLQDRRFVTHERPTNSGQEPLQEVRELEASLHRCKTKLAASLARCRVKLNLQSVSCFLSNPVRTKQRCAKRLPVYAWVDTRKTSFEEVCKALQRAGLSERMSVAEVQEWTFCRDELCPDTLIFSRQLHALLQDSSLSGTHALNTQDRSVCLAVSVLRPLLFDHSDVLVVGSFSALTVAHVALVAAARSGRALVCSADHTPSHVEEIQAVVREMGISNVRILSEAFCGLNEWDATVQRVKVIIVLPQCSSSALNDPVPTMHAENGDWDLLPDLSHGSVSKGKIHTVASQQARLLGHALTFSKVQTVVYCTRSEYPEENEQLVRRVLEKTHTHPKLLPFRVNGPLFPDHPSSGDATDSRFFRLQPSQFANGCFIARLSRQADPTKVETVQDVLARAAAKGLLGGILPEQVKTGKKGKSKKNGKATANSRPPSPSNQNPEDEGCAKRSDKDEECPLQEGEDGIGEETRRGVKGHKRKAKRRGKQTKNHPKTQKKNQSQHGKRPGRSKQRRIPRLTLTLMSSAQPSHHLTPITAVAHRISENSAQQSAPPSAAKHPSPARAAPPTAPASAASARAHGRRAPQEATEKTVKGGDKAVGLRKAREKVVEAEEESKSADSALPPISRSSCSSVLSRSGSAASRCHRADMSAASSAVSLPEL